jgi:hypothetical protein
MDSPHIVYSVLYVSSPRGKHGVRFLCTVALLNKRILVKSMVWVWVVMVLVIIGPLLQVGRVLCVFMHCLYVNYTSHSGKHDVVTDNHGCVRWNVHLMEMFLGGNKLNFYSANH